MTGVTVRRRWLVWAAGVAAYLIAVTQRTTFGVSGIEATERYSVSASQLAVFTVAQLVVYSALQVPVGVLVDRFGSRALISTGALLMMLGQAQLALAETMPGGIAGRLLVGAGDAMTFISVLRLLPAWFEPRRIPILTQWTGIIGQLGQILSVVPFVAVLAAFGWTTAFLAAASLSLLAVVLVLALIRDAPDPRPQRVTATLRQTGASLAAAWRQPGTRLGLWSHFTVQFPGTVFVLIWGFPYLVRGEGLPEALASALMALFVMVGIVCGPLLGLYVARHPLRRSTMILAIVALIFAAWLSVLLYPGPAPLWLLALLVVALAIGGPGSMIGFDFARTFNPSSRLGTATGIVNMGGFGASLLTMYLIGLVLDLLYTSGYSQGNLYALESFRIALGVQLFVLGAGTSAILVVRRRVRRQLAAEGVFVRPLREVLAGERLRRSALRASASRRRVPPEALESSDPSEPPPGA